MKKKLLLIFLSFIILFLGGCTNPAKEFKDEYEALNGQANASGKEHRTITIDKDNPFVKVSASEIVSMIENNETFYVYFGDELCPWCRSVIEKAIEVAKKHNIEKIYYVKIWDKDGKEVLRDKYTIDENNEVTKVMEGTSDYIKLLQHFGIFLSDYTLTDSEGNSIKVGEKRIYAPNFVYIKDGQVEKLTDGISSLQKDPREELTKEILNEEERTFEFFFSE